MKFIQKILIALNIVLISSSIFTVYNFYSAQAELGCFLQSKNIYFRNNIRSTFIIIDHPNHLQIFKNLLQHNVHVMWYKIEKQKIYAVITPSAPTVLPAKSLLNTNNKCHVIIKNRIN